MKLPFPSSVRWRLPLSYAGIALLTAAALGVVLLLTLRGFYARQERAYLASNGKALGEVLANLLAIEVPPEALDAQLNTFSFLTMTRVRLLDRDGVVQADSGDPSTSRGLVTMALQVQVDDASQSFSQTVDSDEMHGFTSLMVIEDANAGLQLSETISLPGVQHATSMPNVQTPFGFGLMDGRRAVSDRSTQVVRVPIHDIDGSSLGYVELSEGPAYGRAIVSSVAWGWGLASAIAVLLAALVGWRVSRRLSDPLLTLKAATERMASGDLSARADVPQPDELGALARSFNEMAERVEHTVGALRRFVADAAHELNTPLTALHTNLELLSDPPASDSQRQFIEQSQAQVERLEMTTRGLLELSKLEAATTPPVMKDVDLGQIALEIGELDASRAEQSGLGFTLALPDQPLIVRGNENQLRQALDNLLDNAIKFTPEGGTVRVTVRAQGEEAVVQIEDTGIGIPPDDMPHLFQRFHRGRNASPYPGSGLGLAVVKAIVEGHGGQVRARSDETGTTCSFTLQLVRPHPNP